MIPAPSGMMAVVRFYDLDENGNVTLDERGHFAVSSYTERHPVVAFSDDGQPMVVADGGDLVCVGALEHAADGYTTVKPARTLVPASGWTYHDRYPNGEIWTTPVVAWLVDADLSESVALVPSHPGSHRLREADRSGVVLRDGDRWDWAASDAAMASRRSVRDRIQAVLPEVEFRPIEPT